MATGPMPQLPISDCIDLEGSQQAQLALSNTAAETAALPEGFYDVWYTGGTDCYIAIGTEVGWVTTSLGYLVLNGNVVTVKIRKNSKLGGIVATGSGNLCYHRIL